MPRWPSASLSLRVLCLFVGILQAALVAAQTRNQALASSNDPGKVAAGWVGSYGPNGRFKADPKHVCSVSAAAVPGARRGEVPGWIDLHDYSQAVVEDLAPPHRRVHKARPRSRSADVFNSLMAFAYGRDPLLNHPVHVALDSKHRLIVVDPSLPAVHVFDGSTSFRIAGGDQRRLQRPSGVAVDADDNLYVADRRTGIIQVYDRSGVFLHSIGTFHGEPIFQEPTAIAIDPQNRRLFVLDTPVNELVVLDLEGNLVRKIGGRRRLAGTEFDLPTEIALRGSTVAVLDLFGTRLHTFNLEGALLHVFRIGDIGRYTAPREMGLGLDSAGNVYVSNGGPGIRVYGAGGKLVGRLNNCEHAASGMWIDAGDRAYISDEAIGRVNVLQLVPPPHVSGSAGAGR